MKCVRPRRGWQCLKTGRTLFYPSKKVELGPERVLPCGKCDACRVTQVSQLATRIEHEALGYDFSSFLTLTFSDQHYPDDPDHWHRRGADFQSALRERGVRSVVVFETGDTFGRPHCHAGVFGEAFAGDRKPFGKSRTGHQLYRSADLDKLWPWGYAYIEDLNPGLARYLAGYIGKKLAHRPRTIELVHPLTGEIRAWPAVMPACLPRRPALGLVALSTWQAQVLAGELRGRGGERLSIPRAYRNELKRSAASDYAEMQAREEYARLALVVEEVDEARAQVIEECIRARLNQKGR